MVCAWLCRPGWVLLWDHVPAPVPPHVRGSAAGEIRQAHFPFFHSFAHTKLISRCGSLSLSLSLSLCVCVCVCVWTGIAHREVRGENLRLQTPLVVQRQLAFYIARQTLIVAAQAAFVNKMHGVVNSLCRQNTTSTVLHMCGLSPLHAVVCVAFSCRSNALVYPKPGPFAAGLNPSTKSSARLRWLILSRMN
jgi:hypothetical protein